MARDVIKLSRKDYDELLDQALNKREIVGILKNEVQYLKDQKQQYFNFYMELSAENGKLQRENEHLKILFDKEGDTQVIKYNGKLYGVTSINHYKDGAEDTLDVRADLVGEVN